jgi:hypothetical protein
MFKMKDAIAAGAAAGVVLMSPGAAVAGGDRIAENPHWYWPTMSDFSNWGVLVAPDRSIQSFGNIRLVIPPLTSAVAVSGDPGDGAGIGILFADGAIAVYSTLAAARQIPAGLPPCRYFILEEGVAMAIDRNGVLRMWGSTQFPSWGNPGHLAIPANLGAVKMARQQNGRVLALKPDGTVRAWGLNNAGQANVPANLTDVVKISAGKYHSLALRGDGTLIAWGASSAPPAGRYIDMAAGHNRSVAIRDDGVVVNFGGSQCSAASVPNGIVFRQLFDDYGYRGGADCSGFLTSFGTCLPAVPPGIQVATYDLICDPSFDFFGDCDGNAEPDFDQIMNAPDLDSDFSGILDSCETPPDCDSNGIPDATEIAQGMPDVDGNGVPDNCQCLADINETGNVNGIDLAIVLGVWGTTGSKYPTADINHDGVVNAEDLGIVLAGWGPCP